MPIYEYECEACGERFEELVAVTTAEVPCPECGSELEVMMLEPVGLALAPAVEEDWGQ